MEMNKKMSSLKRFQCLPTSMCSTTTDSHLTDVRCNLDFYLDDDIDEDVVVSTPTTTAITNKRKRSHALLQSVSVDHIDEDTYESPAKLIKLDNYEEEMDTSNNDVHNRNHTSTLPTVEGYQTDLIYITPQTLEKALHGEQTCDKDVLIVDCRYPYEYEGGHIKDAVNLYTREMIKQTFLDQHKNLNNCILVFHCEFSSERGPKLCRYLREQDRSINSEVYPHLYYPEMYVLQGGYKSFYQQCTTALCEPQQYRPMIHPAFTTQLKHYRKETKKWKRSKSWSGRSTERMCNVSTTLCFEV